MKSVYYAGESPDWNKIYARVRRYVIGKVPEADVDDVVQEAVFAINNNLKAYNISKAKFSTWFLIITRNKVVDWHRKHGVINSTLLDYGQHRAINSHQPDDSDIESINLKLFLVCLEKVSPRHKALLWLMLTHSTISPKELHDLTNGANISTTKSRVRRALDAIRANHAFVQKLLLKTKH